MVMSGLAVARAFIRCKKISVLLRFSGICMKIVKPSGSGGLRILIRSRSRKIDKKINVNGYAWLFYTFY